MPNRKYIMVLFLVFFILFTGACRQKYLIYDSVWSLDNVRILDGVDALFSEYDLVALYTRDLPDIKQVRLDFLELPDIQTMDVIVGFDCFPGGNTVLPFSDTSNQKWDIILYFSSQGKVQVYQADRVEPRSWLEKSNIPVQIIRNPQDDTVIISLNIQNLDYFSPQTEVQAWIINPEDKKVYDRTKSISWNAVAPEGLPVLFAFSDTFPVFTPAQALRRWDGAHTGPNGGRHGLYNLLRTAQSSKIPVLLLDLCSPSSLNGLDYINNLDLVHTLQNQNLLYLASPIPKYEQVFPEWIVKHFHYENRINTENYGLRLLNLVYDPGIQVNLPYLYQKNTHNLITAVKLITKQMNDQELFVIPELPFNANIVQATIEGPSEQLKEVITQLASRQIINQDEILVLGGSLPQSSWGNPQAARETFRYLKNRPWIRILSTRDLRKEDTLLVLGSSQSLGEDPSNLMPDWLLENLRKSPDNQITKAAWYTFRALFSPIFPKSNQINELRQNYLGDVNVLLTVAQWVNQPEEISSCNFDPDKDGNNECILASRSVFSMFELERGALAYLFMIKNGQVHQIIGPTSQIITGLSDPLDWSISEGRLTDPSVISGAFSNSDMFNQVRIFNDTIELASSDGLIIKNYRLHPCGINLEMHLQEPQEDSEIIKIPLLLDPWSASEKNGYRVYQGTTTNNRYIWSNSDIAYSIEVSTPFEVVAFIDSKSYLSVPEDPNFEYPEGHRLPFPFAILRIDSSSLQDIHIEITCNQ